MTDVVFDNEASRRSPILSIPSIASSWHTSPNSSLGESAAVLDSALFRPRCAWRLAGAAPNRDLRPSTGFVSGTAYSTPSPRTWRDDQV